MIRHVKNKGLFNKDVLEGFGSSEKLIEVAQFPDKQMFLHNGHHRCVAIWLGGRFQLAESEYYIKQWKYEDYENISFDNQYYTPFSIVNEVRIQNLAPYKEFIHNLIYEFGESMASDVIWQAKPLYATKRKLKTIKDLAAQYAYNLSPDTRRWLRALAQS